MDLIIMLLILATGGLAATLLNEFIQACKEEFLIRIIVNFALVLVIFLMTAFVLENAVNNTFYTETLPKLQEEGVITIHEERVIEIRAIPNNKYISKIPTS